MATTSHTSRRCTLDDSHADTTDELVSETASDAPPALQLLEDDYAREILQALATGPMRGRDLIETCHGSRPTVYRRLERLEDAGYVTTETHLDPDGHHCKQFHLARDTLRVIITAGTISVTTR